MSVAESRNNDTYILNLESQLQAKSEDYSCFPDIPTEQRVNTISYPSKYESLKAKLGELHDKVEFEAALKSLEEEINNGSLSEDLYDRITTLNRHGKSHVEKVIENASILAKCIVTFDKDKNITNEEDILTPFEVFVLLCAIQIHDIGNMYGRENHTESFHNDFEKYAKEAEIKEPVLIKFISNTARVHGGKIRNNADTIGAAHLKPISTVLGKDVRQRMLAAVLRFADELADDSTRAYDISEMPKYSKIFHAYSKSLHSVVIEKIESENVHYIKLCYYLPIKDALSPYAKLTKNKNGNLKLDSVLLINEIVERTKKMERERRYCSRFLLPHIVIKQIKVEIEIDLGGFNGEERIEYTLEETGYPDEMVGIPAEVEVNINRLMCEYASGGV